MNCEAAGSGWLRWIIQRCRRIGFASAPVSRRAIPGRTWTKRPRFSRRRWGLWVAQGDYPAGPQNRICFRACVTARHTRADLDEALNILEDTLVPSLVAQNA